MTITRRPGFAGCGQEPCQLPLIRIVHSESFPVLLTPIVGSTLLEILKNDNVRVLRTRFSARLAGLKMIRVLQFADVINRYDFIDNISSERSGSVRDRRLRAYLRKQYRSSGLRGGHP